MYVILSQICVRLTPSTYLYLALSTYFCCLMLALIFLTLSAPPDYPAPVITGNPTIAVSVSTPITLTCKWPVLSNRATLNWVDPISKQLLPSEKSRDESGLTSVYRVLADPVDYIHECQVSGVNATDEDTPLRDRVAIPVIKEEKGNSHGPSLPRPSHHLHRYYHSSPTH